MLKNYWLNITKYLKHRDEVRTYIERHLRSKLLSYKLTDPVFNKSIEQAVVKMDSYAFPFSYHESQYSMIPSDVNWVIHFERFQLGTTATYELIYYPESYRWSDILDFLKYGSACFAQLHMGEVQLNRALGSKLANDARARLNTWEEQLFLRQLS